MKPLDMDVTVAKSFDMKTSFMRGLWFKHDFLSDHCPSYHPSTHAHVTSLIEAVKIEQKIKNSMIEKHLDEMRKTRKAYEDKMEAKRVQQELDRKNRKPKPKTADGKKRKKIKVEVEPPIVDETTFVDVEAEYVAFEDLQYFNERDINKCSNVALAEGEVNMREFQVINGIFKVECFKRPHQTKEINHQMFLRLSKLVNSGEMQE